MRVATLEMEAPAGGEEGGKGCEPGAREGRERGREDENLQYIVHPFGNTAFLWTAVEAAAEAPLPRRSHSHIVTAAAARATATQ